MHKRVRELIAYAQLCGFRLDGIDGSEHFVLVHSNGSRYRVPGTPSEYRGDENAKADLRRLSGVTPPKPRAGKFRHERATRAHVPASVRVDSVSSQLEKLEAEFYSICDAIEEHRIAGDRDAVAALLPELLRVEAQFGRHKIKPPTRRFRAFW